VLTVASSLPITVQHHAVSVVDGDVPTLKLFLPGLGYDKCRASGREISNKRDAGRTERRSSEKLDIWISIVEPTVLKLKQFPERARPGSTLCYSCT